MRCLSHSCDSCNPACECGFRYVCLCDPENSDGYLQHRIDSAKTERNEEIRKGSKGNFAVLNIMHAAIEVAERSKMKTPNLNTIGFYTLSDERAAQSSETSPLMRCELLLTDLCNFKCPYCRCMKDDQKGTLKEEEALAILKVWCDQGLQNVRFSGGEPTLVPFLGKLVRYCKERGVKRIAVSSNGSQRLFKYIQLIDEGVNDFSISLDSGCCATGDTMAGNITGSWERVVNNIRELAKLTYVTVGMVFTEQNVDQCQESV